ncbi:MAG: SRPBCC domain-containing protein [Betaproteobacteria bacterium]|nr:MAG: SRPBCC domain-containing protein [Betaproteobacteria bacterium]
MQRAVPPVNRIFLRFVLSILLGLSVPALSHAAERAIDKEITIAASLDDAWSAWTTRDGIVSFFAPEAVIDARVGGAFHIHINPLGEPGSKGADDMRFLALQPKQMISFDWNAPPHLPEARAQRTFVIVRFVAVDDKTTKVTLHHTGWGNGGEWDKTFTYFERAWGSVLGNLKKRFETGPMDWTPWLAQLKKRRDDAAAKK